MPKLRNKELTIQSKLLGWYKKNRRILPWRKLDKKKLPNPYYVLVSEFMLQQTTVNAVISRFKNFMKIWPNLKKLSMINENQILQFWSGLGYYARAKNLLNSAKIISHKFNNIVPDNYYDLIDLPGVGDYTAKAILGIGYNKSVMPVDANIKRMLARLYGLDQSINLINKEITSLSKFYASKKQSSNLIQAFMDYGSIICVPRNPRCGVCIIAKECIANQKKITNTIPKKIKSKKTKMKKYTRAYVIVNGSKEILVRRRASKGMLPSMLEVPNDKWVAEKKLLVKDSSINLFQKKFTKCKPIIYSFSHFDLAIDIYFTKERKRRIKNHDWVLLKNIAEIGMPTVMKKITEVAKLN
ncbi:MAG: A/G-specific adenine glycosylase [Pelagibacteraceae bacterium]|jgi:A/G-specific adenine glycosylase|nr:A/G-specific adenine glycosylase [Pelagibacteraceae bacterium]HJL58242.1 A/G-specific adenine glycosylase [Alphaproteobacteria bacterium]MBO6467195.1 A/G-specific adenine glycosylase [Pelagibacteraceae bacterium]MBO6468893.1 A/G-specific adenine glycosylase [Pelagibacteraceae bacterium]MBO6470584.1 A/G-specific adenine glycosylase [Pelagibacteraceae bacterium]|tara:strand:+ start:320 stop:1384 length:1065 start_codon:yes stop_codon:yes gene_type:complete